MRTPSEPRRTPLDSVAYVRTRFAFEAAIRTARKAGTSDEEIAHVMDLSVPMVEAVAGQRR